MALAEQLEHDALLRERQLQAAKFGRPHDNEPAAP
jgi:hypothetical protein